MSDWLAPSKTAVVTGGAGGIGYAAATRFVYAGMNVVLADLDGDKLSAARETLAADGASVVAQVCDVSDPDQVVALCDRAYAEFGAVHCLMNNAGVGMKEPWADVDVARKTLEINLWGVISGCQAFIPRMLEGGHPGVVINTGSKQGITKPPGNWGYNLSKAGVLAYTESVVHAFVKREGCALTAHLLVPGFVYTPMTAGYFSEKPAFAATADETVDFMLQSVARGDFYILCPDNETPRSLDEKRIQWMADDLIHNRPALSRWHPEHADAFKAFIAED